MNNKGFTLIELMIVVVIIGILAAIAIPNFISMQNRAKEASVKSNMHTIQLAAEDFSTITEGTYPSDCATTIGQVRTVIFGAGDPLAADPRSLCGAAAGLTPAAANSMVPSNMRNPIVGANNAFQSVGINAVHAPGTSGTVGFESFDNAAATPAAIGAAVRYEIDGDGVTAVIATVLTSGQ
jgi:prepilin-type N-terminal cleavage/methylation domain-containing protein